MPFQDNPYFTPLFDTLRGGGPRAWECHLPVVYDSSEKRICKEGEVIHPTKIPTHGYIRIDCGKICKTLEGMYQHLVRVHNFTPQAVVDFTTKGLAGEAAKDDNSVVIESERENSD